MHENNFPLLISIQSQKGGVGKTSVAFHVSRILLKSHEVLYIDLDLTGTEAATAAGVLCMEAFWSELLHIVPAPNAKENAINLVTLFGQYMRGNILPKVQFLESRDEILKDKNFLQLRRGQINIISSYLERQERNSTESNGHGYGPSVLFDSLHAEWFLDLLKEIVTSSGYALKDKPLAVVFDNAPGYSGLEPALEEWLTDIGPIQSKFLFVASPDTQDRNATSKAMHRVYELQQDKEIAAAFFHNLNQVDLSARQQAFFLRIIDTAPNDIKKCIFPKPNKSEHDECMDCDLCYYLSRDCINKNTSKIKTPCNNFIRAILNKVPIDFMSGDLIKFDDGFSLQENPGNNVPLLDLCISNENAIPLFDDLVFQYCCDHVSKKTSRNYPHITSEEIISTILKLEDEKNILYKKGQDAITILKDSSEITTSPSIKSIEIIFTIFNCLKEWDDNLRQKYYLSSINSSCLETSSPPSDLLGLNRFLRLQSIVDTISTESKTVISDISIPFCDEYPKRLARLLWKDYGQIHSATFSSLNIDKNLIPNEHIFMNILVFSLAFQNNFFEKCIHKISKILIYITALDFLLEFNYWEPASGKRLNLGSNAKKVLIDTKERYDTVIELIKIEDLVDFYLIFTDLRQSLLSLPDDILFIFEVYQTLVGTPKPTIIYSPAILGVAKEVISNRTVTHDIGRQLLGDFGQPIVDNVDRIVTLAPDSYDLFKQGRSFEEFNRKLVPIISNWFPLD
uniref:CobQ/CobB/MinD/ParA nucleotide binding domain-containing protein n=1 Tax=Desulfovibrio sp. U5L TaxID=596152 RepID=I2Q1C1_9BACT